MVDFDKMTRDVEYSDILKIIDEKNGEPYVFKNIGVNSQDGSNNIKKREFRNLTFINCNFSYLSLGNCRVVDCNFINCRFYDSSIFNNLVESSEIIGVEFANNTWVHFNVFDGLSGFLDENQWCIENQNNVFKNMDFSGFLPLYTSPDHSACDIVCGKNFFYNTTVSLEALEKLSNRAQFFCSTRECGAPSKLIRTIIEDENEDGYLIKDKLGIAEYFVPSQFLIDLRNMDPEEKLNLVASTVTNIYDGSYLRVSFNGRNLDDSLFKFYSTPNPLPAKIVDSRGFSLKKGVIRDIGIKMNWPLDAFEPCFFDGNTIGDKSNRLYMYNEEVNKYTEANNLHNPDNYECKQLIKI